MDSASSTPAMCSLFCAAPNRAVENRGEKHPAVLGIYFPMCVMFDELPPTNCVFSQLVVDVVPCPFDEIPSHVDSHASSHDPFRLIDL
jgi:hypothetical protein